MYFIEFKMLYPLIQSVYYMRSICFSAILLLIIYTTFCDTFQQTDIHLDFLSLLSIVFLSEYNFYILQEYKLRLMI